MSDSPPDWVTQGGPSTGATGGAPAQRRGNYPRQDQPSQEDIRANVNAFNVWLDLPATRHKIEKFLHDLLSLDAFLETARTAIQANPDLLQPKYQDGLMAGILKAAQMAIPPDGKYGALIPRYDNKAKTMRVVFQPMYQGIIMAGRRTGAIQQITTGIIFRGEKYRIEGGEHPILEHSVDLEIADEAYAAMNTQKSKRENSTSSFVTADTKAFMDRVLAAYCVIHASDGATYPAWITKSRLEAIRLSAADYGPWAGPFIDEMCKKSPIFLASKMIDLGPSTPKVAAYRAALLDGLAIEVDDEPQQRALPAPAPLDKLRTMEAMFGGEKDPEPRTETPRDEPKRSPPKAARSEPKEDPPKDEPKNEPVTDDTPQFKTIKQFREFCIGAVKELRSIEEIEVFESKAWFQARLDATRAKDLKSAQEIEDAFQDRKTFVAQLPKEGNGG
jgi:recombinational DNA repair protein RecT